MMTVVTDVQLREGTERQWETVMRERMTAVKEQPGWVAGQLLRAENEPRRRVIVGTWRTRRLGSLAPRPAVRRDEMPTRPARRRAGKHLWHEVMVDARSGDEERSARRPR